MVCIIKHNWEYMAAHWRKCKKCGNIETLCITKSKRAYWKYRGYAREQKTIFGIIFR